jgi:hypothetical protein
MLVTSEFVAFTLGDVVRLKKPHPCGGFEWSVVRLGADIGLRCQVCGRRVLLPRREIERRLKGFVTRASQIETDVGSEAMRIDENDLEAQV